jgi:multimeric flavodoxin WrbA
VVLVVGVMGSPRSNGNSDRLLDAALKGARGAGAEVVRVALQSLDFAPCDACGRCEGGGACVINDDMDRLYDLFDSLDALLVASPIYFSGLTAQTKSMVDRCHCLWVREERGLGPIGKGRKRFGAFLTVGADQRPRFDIAISQIKAFYNTINVEYVGEVTVPSTDKAGDIDAHPLALEAAARLGRQLVERSEGRSA